MPSSSPYQNNDYQAANSYRPYQLPINSIFKAISSQDQFWQEGAARVKNVYDNALGMSLTLDQNKEVRDKFMKDAEAQITKLNNMNLSDPSVQRQGINIYKPLFDDKAIQYDNAITKTKQGIFSTAESYRNKKLSKDGRVGEGFNRTNLEDALDGFEEFNSNSARDANKLEQLHAKLGNKAYQPYYNYSKEMQDIAKNCKGISTQSPQEINGLVMDVVETGSEADRVRACLTYNLSDEAKSQIGIEARRSFKNRDNTINIGALRDTYNGRYTERLESLNKKDKNLIASKALYEKQLTETKDPKWKKLVDFVSSQIDQNTSEMENLVDGYNKLNIGDQDFVNENYERLAQSIYSGNLIDGFSTAFQTKSIKTTVSPYEIMRSRLEMGYENDKQLAAQKFEYDKQLAVLSGSMKGKKLDNNGNIVDDVQPVDAAQVAGDITTKGMEEFEKLSTDNRAQVVNLTKSFFNGFVDKHWQGKEEDFYNPETGELTEAGNKYITDAQALGDRDVLQYLDKVKPLQLSRKVMEATRESVENDPSVKNLSADWRTKISNEAEFPPVILPDGTRITALDVQNALEGQGGRLKVVKGADWSDDEGNLHTGGNEYYLDGRRIDSSQLRDSFGNRTDFNKLRSTVEAGAIAQTSTILKTKNELYGKAIISQEGRVTNESLNLDKENPIRNKILNQATLAGATGIDIDNVKILDYNLQTGNASVMISLDPKKGASIPDIKDMLETLKTSLGATPSRIHKSLKDNTIVFDITEKSLISDDYKNNAFSGEEGNLNTLNQVLQNSNMDYKLGKRIEDKTIYISGKGVNYSLVPYKDVSGSILWDVNKEDKTKPGKYENYKRDQNVSNILSIINTK